MVGFLVLALFALVVFLDEPHVIPRREGTFMYLDVVGLRGHGCAFPKAVKREATRALCQAPLLLVGSYRRK